MSETKYESGHVWRATGEGYVIQRITDGLYHSMTSFEVCKALARIEALEWAVRRVLDNGWLADTPNSVVQELRTALREVKNE